MPKTRSMAIAALTALAASGLVGVNAAPSTATGLEAGKNPAPLRVATYNASLNRNAAGQLVTDLSTGTNAQARAVAEVIQRTRPDVLLINEFDYVSERRAVNLFRDNYLEVGQNGAAPIDFPYAYVAPSNTGIPSGFDLNNNGQIGGGDDAFGFGLFEGQFGMVVYSRYPIDTERVRTFQLFKWKDMPGALLPDDPATAAPADWYSPAELDVVRLSSKSHWDVPILVGRRTVHLLASHPTPPTFDGPEDRNGRRNHDEIRFWADYVQPGKRSQYIYDDTGRYGGLRPGAAFVVAGDQNSDPIDGDSVPGSIQQLIEHPRIIDPLPASAGGAEAAVLQGGANASHRGDPKYDTADFADVPAPGNLRADYVLPSKQLRPQAAGVFWPVRSDPLFRLTGVFPFPTSDHRLVWVDVRVPGGVSQPGSR
ncbi:endonuclease/exonuclease/phosphatase family protein [Kribbella sancticallisti]|uniref:Endonuclease/exonuclease/phosphatase family protein n=1 Tax=Kribbella sancticallisti TaxID=460087 RepID=A0ABP4Q9K6_9ACTN